MTHVPAHGFDPVFQTWARIAGVGLAVTVATPEGARILAVNQAGQDILGTDAGIFPLEGVANASAPTMVDWEHDGIQRTLEVQTVAGERDGQEADFVFFRDVTMELEAIRRHSRLMADLAGANEDLQTFTRAATHDLRGPLRSIQGFTQLLARRMQGPDHASERHLLDSIWESSQRMDELIDALGQLASVGSRKLVKKPVDLNMIIGEVLADMTWQLDDVHVDVGPLPVVSADAGLLRQLLQNLIGNALKFRREGVEHHVAIDHRRDGDWYIRISDNGVGFDHDQASQLFRPFERMPEAQQFPGSGIGLSTCKRIVELHGGTITAEGRPGLGATFTVRLPA